MPILIISTGIKQKLPLNIYSNYFLGGHINPAVSLMFLTFRQINGFKFAIYCIAQLLGAFFGAALAYLVYKGIC